MTTDEVIKTMREWNAVITSKLHRTLDLTAIADAVEALQTENAELQADHEALKGVMQGMADEKNSRIYYQDIVYALCNMVDKHYGNRTVCGCFTEPSTELQTRVNELLTELKLYRPMTESEIEVALAEVQSKPLDDETLQRIMAKVMDPTFTPTEPEHVLLIAKIRTLEAENAELRKQQVRYIEHPGLPENGPLFYDADQDKYYKLIGIAPRTPGNTVPLVKEPSVVEQVVDTIHESAMDSGINIPQQYREFIANRLNAAGLLRKD